MRAGGAATVELVLRAGGAVGDNAGAARPAGRAVHADAVLWGAPDDRLAARRRGPRQPEAGAPPAAAAGVGGTLPQAAHECAGAWASLGSISAARGADHLRRPSVVERHHLHSVGAGLGVPGRDPGLVQPVRPR